MLHTKWDPQKSHTLTSVIMEFTFGILWKEIYLFPSHVTVSKTYQKHLFKKMTYIIDCVHNLKCYICVVANEKVLI